MAKVNNACSLQEWHKLTSVKLDRPISHSYSWCWFSLNFSSPPSLPPTIDPAVALHCFRSQRGLLLNLIRHCLPSLANSLLAENIIPQDLCERACNQCLGSGERGGAVLDCIEAAIQAMPSDFTAVVQILESERFLESEAKKLVENYCE